MVNKENSKERPRMEKLLRSIRNNAFSLIMGTALIVMLVNSDAKSFVLRQMMLTGLFNANIDEKDASEKSVGTKIDFNFEDENGTVQNTTSLRNKVVFINFWASWCPPCRAEFPSIETLYLTFKDNPEVFFLVINMDSKLSTAKAYLNKEQYSIPLYTSHGGVPKEIFSGALPTTIVLDKDGKIRFHHTGFANYSGDGFLRQIGELIKE
ncbi:TlpA family protein disulfide reductase [Arcticibacter sp.]|uniref:TlpA family protein disulfide reductase n=1 Tax=Arcticibacter sp. TaxID=1872630 RepID=UPI00388FF558